MMNWTVSQSVDLHNYEAAPMERLKRKVALIGQKD